MYDLQSLAALEAQSGGNLPLSVTYTGARPALPGLTWTGPQAGYLTPSSAAAFGWALCTGAAGGVTRIALPARSARAMTASKAASARAQTVLRQTPPQRRSR